MKLNKMKSRLMKINKSKVKRWISCDGKEYHYIVYNYKFDKNIFINCYLSLGLGFICIYKTKVCI